MRNPTKGFVHEEVNSLEVEWYTPPFIFQKLNTIFDMDVCSAGLGKDYVPSFKKFTMESYCSGPFIVIGFISRKGRFSSSPT